MHRPLVQTAHTPPARAQRRWLWLLLAAWLLTQSWAWMHRVEHGQRLSGLPSPGHAEWMSGSPHDRADCKFLDHALLGAVAGSVQPAPGLLAFGQAAPATITPTDARPGTAQPYLARAPPLATRLTEGRARV